MGNDVPWDKGLAEQQAVQNLVESESQGLSLAAQMQKGSVGPNSVSCGSEKPPYQQPVHWERFIPKGSLKVLLVENDDSTRHVVSALLKNCSYEVTAVENGLQAWRILADITNHVDLVLTEVAMPVLSGVGLLCKMMSHKTFKTIPVIMMSTHDSMGLVFRCLSKGAIDFLVKPIRKNELKNLWQHVWRRCHSSSGSGSESDTQTRTSSRSKSICNAGSSDEHENGSIGISILDGSDTQSSCTRRGTGKESPLPVSPCHQLTNTADRTCAQAIHTRNETFSILQVKVSENNRFREQVEQLGNDQNVDFNKNHECEDNKLSLTPTSHIQNQLPELDSQLPEKERRIDCNENNNANGKNHWLVNCSSDSQSKSQALEAPKVSYDLVQIKNKANCDSELTLKSLRQLEEGVTSVHDERNILRRSDLSAFSKYNAAYASQAQTGNLGCRSPPDNCSGAMKTDMTNDSNGNRPYNLSNGSCNKNNVATIIKYATMPEAINSKSESLSGCKKLLNSTAFQPVLQNGHASIFEQQLKIPLKADGEAVDHSNHVDINGSNQQFQVQHHHHHYHHHHHHVHRQSQRDHGGNNSPKNTTPPDSSQCGSSDMLGGSKVEGNSGNENLNGSNSGSKHGSNEPNGSSKGLNAVAANVKNDNGARGDSGVVGSSGTAENRLPQREVDLTKFRQKRKERGFGKKVSHQSRKKLVKQKPHVKGQFVLH